MQNLIGMDILKPMIALAGWTMVMWVWMFITRIPALKAARIDIANHRGGTGRDLEGKLPDKVMWPAHNYNHLHEAPTLFYAVALTLAIIGQGSGVNYWFAWAYVGFRVAHSLVQATFNKVGVRFLMYLCSMIALIGLVLHAAIALWH